MANENEMVISVGGTAKQWFDVVEQIKKKNKDLTSQMDSSALESNRYKAKLNSEYLRLTQQVAKDEAAAYAAAARSKEASATAASQVAIKAAQATATANEKATADQLAAAKEAQTELEGLVTKTAQVSAVAFAASASAIALVTGQFIDFEKALVGVGKTTNVNGDDLKNFGKAFQDLSTRIPIATNELLGIAQAAGQLGVRGQENLLKFTETVGKLGVATDLSGEDAAVALTRILTVTREGVGDIDKFGSVIVALGNNFAASESEIVRVTTEVARSTAVFNVSAAQAAALSTAMRSLGVQAELGGSAVGRSFRAIDTAIRGGGKSLAELSRLTGIASKDLKGAFAENSTAVFQKFIEGLGLIEKAGGSTTAELKKFGLRGEEILKVIPVLALNSELLGRALNTAAGEMANATALNKEANTAFATLGSNVQLTKNEFTNLGVQIGEKLAPEVNTLLQGISKIANAFVTSESASAGFLAGFLKFTASIAASIAIVAGATLAYFAYKKVLDQIAVAALVARGAVVGFTTAATLGLSLIISFLPEIIDGIGQLFASLEKKPDLDSLDEVTRKIKEISKTRDDLDKRSGPSGYYKDQIDALDEQLKKLKEIQQEKIKGTKDFGTGSLLIKPTMGALDALPGDNTQALPLRPDNEIAAEKAKRTELDAMDAAATTKKLQRAKDEADKLRQINIARISGVEKDEADLIAKRATIEDERNQIQFEKDAEVKAALLEANRQKLVAQELDEQAFREKQDENDKIYAEQKKAFELLSREEDLAQTQEWSEEDQQKLIEGLTTQQEIERQFAADKVQKFNQQRVQQYADEQKYGKQAAALKTFFAKEEVQNFKSVTGDLSELANSRNSTMKAIGKAAARVNAAIATAEGAIKAYTSLAGIPIIGPALGAAAAAALVAYGVERQSQISAMATGGVVGGLAGVTAGSRDRVPILAEPGEIIVPKAQAGSYIQSQGIPDTQANPTKGVEDKDTIIEINLNERASELITLDQRKGKALGIVGNS